MKKLLLIMVLSLTLIVSGCTTNEQIAGFRDDGEAWYNQCVADTTVNADGKTCEDVFNHILEQSDMYLELQAELLEHENRISSLEEMTEPEYLRYIQDKWIEFVGNGDCGSIPSIDRVDDGNGNFTVTIYINGKYEAGCVYSEEQTLTILVGLHSELVNYTIHEVIYND